MTPGYLDEPEETAAILHDGWLWTGDLAERDADGFFYHRGRSKEILKIGGHRVSPIEIEQVIGGHPDVAEAAVIGVPDALMGEVPAASWSSARARLSEEELRLLQGAPAGVPGSRELHPHGFPPEQRGRKAPAGRAEQTG